MSIKATPNGYMVDIRPQGRDGKRYRKSFKTKNEALQYERWLIATQHNKGWVERSRDLRPFSALIELWYLHHGATLKKGLRDKGKLLKIAEAMGNPKSYAVTKNAIMNFRASQVAKGLQPSSINRDQALISSVFTVLIKVDEYHQEHPIKGMTKLKLRGKEMGFLSIDEIKRLLNHLTGDLLLIAKICLSTGARWNEASTLRGNQVANGRLTFIDTKNGKNRTIPIPKELFVEIYKGKSGALFHASYNEFSEIIKSLNFELPKGQVTHVLRHSYASHFIINGGNILTLQKILGHATITQTMVYAHLAPDYLQDAITYSPMTTICPK